MGDFLLRRRKLQNLERKPQTPWKYYLKFFTRVCYEHVVDFPGDGDYSESRPSPKPRKRRRSLSSSAHNETDSKHDDAGKKRGKSCHWKRNREYALDVFLHGADILKRQGGKQVSVQNESHARHCAGHGRLATRVMFKEHSFGHESPNSVTHSPSGFELELLTKLIDAERKSTKQGSRGWPIVASNKPISCQPSQNSLCLYINLGQVQAPRSRFEFCIANCGDH